MLKNRFKSVVSLGLSAVMVFGMLDNFNIASNVYAENLSGLDAWEITEQMTVGWNLGNSLDVSASWLDSSTNTPSEFAQAWGNPEPTYELIKAVKDCGFNTIRIPTTWYQHVYYDGSSYVIEDEWMSYVKKFVDYAYEMDMFIILNVHHEEGWINVAEFNDYTLSQAKTWLEDVWQQISEEFKNYDQHLIFEGMNEPRQTGNSNVAEWGNGDEDGGYTYNYLNQLSEVFINTVRSNGSDQNKERLLMIPSYHATASKSPLMELVIPENSGNVAISVHAYEPYPFTMDTSQSKVWSGGYADWSGYQVSYDTLLNNVMSDLKAVSDAKNAPIIIGEFGASDFGNTQDRANWAKDYLTLAQQNGFVCVLWDNNAVYNGSNAGGENHGYINRTDYTLYESGKPVIDAIMKVVNSNVKDSFWDSFTVDDSWIEIKKYSSGKSLTQWSGEKITTDLTYLNDNYRICVVYSGETPPRGVLENAYDYAWYSVENPQTGVNIAYFDYEDFANVLSENDVTIYDIGNLIVQATSQTTLYGVYAVAVENDSNESCVHVDENGDGYCDLCKGMIDGNSAQLKGYSLTLDGSIGVNFYMDLSEDVRNDETAYIKFKINGKEQTVDIKDATQSKINDNDQTYYVFTCNVAAAEMTMDITAQLISGEYTSAEYKFTVQDYAKYILDNENSYSNETVAFVKALLNYGANAQNYFNKNTTKLANSILDESDKTLSNLTATNFESYKPVLENGESVGKFTSYYLNLSSETSIKVKFKPADGVDMSKVKFYIGEDEVTDYTTLSDGKILIVKSNINALNLDTTYTFKVEDANGNTSTAKVSAYSYIHTVFSQTDEKYNTLKKVMQALYDFSQKAKEYSASQES